MQTVPRNRLDFNHIHKIGVLRIALGQGGHVRFCQGIDAPALIHAVFVRGVPCALRQAEHTGHDARRHLGHRLRSQQCLQLLGRLIALRSGPVAVALANWDKLDRGPRLSLLRQASAASGNLEGEQDRASVLAFLQDRAQRILRLPGDREGATGSSPLRERPLRELGLDSVMAVEFRNAIESRFRVPIPVQSILSGPSLEQLAERILELLARGGVTHDPQPLPHLSDQEVRQLLAQLEAAKDSAANLPSSGG